MAKFIKCSCENAEYHGYKQHNSPINIDLVTQIEKTTVSYYPDNEGTPAIKFHGINITWIYAKNETKQRDKDYEFLIKNN